MASINKHDVLLVWVLLGSLLGLDGYVRADPLQGPFTITSDKIGSLNTKTILYTLNGTGRECYCSQWSIIMLISLR